MQIWQSGVDYKNFQFPTYYVYMLLAENEGYLRLNDEKQRLRMS